jgi:hypothetical protein
MEVGTVTFLDLYRDKYTRLGGSAGQFLEAYRHADPEKVVDYLLERHPEGIRGALIATAGVYRDTCRTHCDTLVALLQQGRAAMTYERLAAELPEAPDPFTIGQSYDVDWAIDRRDLNWVK